jgi:hypothetical protein
VLVQDLNKAYDDGYSIRDHSKSLQDPACEFRMRVCVLNWIGDYQGQGKIANMKHSGGQACHWCRHFFRKGLGTCGSCFADNNRRYTPPESPLRYDSDYGDDKPDAADNRPPAQRTHASIWATGWEITCGDKTKAEIAILQEATGINGLCVLGLLPLFDLCWDIVLDMMHVIKNIWPEHLLRAFAGVGAPAKPKRRTENNKGPAEIAVDRKLHRDRLALFAEVHQDHRVWTLDKKQRDLVDARGTALALGKWIPKHLRIFSKAYKCVTWTRLTRSAAWHYLLGGLYPAGQQEALTSLIDLLAIMHYIDCDLIDTPDSAERERNMKVLKTKVILTLLLFEREFPRTLLLVCLHNLLHVPDMIGRWNNVRNLWAFFMERMVGWLKNFVKTTALPAASLVKGYTIHMLARRAPTALVESFAKRRKLYANEMATRGHLILASTKIAERQHQPGCGKLVVTLTRRNHRELMYARLPAAFKTCFTAYNNAMDADDRFSTNTANMNFYIIHKGPAVMINGRPLPMMADVDLGIRYIHNGVPAYGDIGGVIYVLQNDHTKVLFLSVFPRELIEEKRTAATVRAPDDVPVFIEAFKSITHIVKFVQHPSQPAGYKLCLKVWATCPGWEINT